MRRIQSALQMLVRAGCRIEQELDLGEIAIELADLDPRVKVQQHAIELDERPFRAGRPRGSRSM